ncbi:MAG: aldo/keto reductase [Tissierellia bacterium]|nr:aldo/keto reductase [Tissierellia bacterium]
MRTLGKSGIQVSSLCFGTLTMTPFQANLSVKDGAALICRGFEKGINFVDTAEIYENYNYIKEALKSIPRKDLVIATKCYAYDEKGAEKSLKYALEELGVDYIDIMLLHEQESEHTLRGHYPALEYFFKQKEKGWIRATGISTHFIRCVNAAKKYEEIEVVHPIINKRGIGIQDGTVLEMVDAIKSLKENGVGIYSMKALGGGHLQSQAIEAIEWIKSIPYIDATAVGMQSIDEVDFNCDLFFHHHVNEDLEEKVRKKERHLIIADYCIGCGNCVKRCKQDAIHVVEGKAQVNESCILCGYCATVCPEFCIKVI